MDQTTQHAVKEVIRGMMNRVLRRRLELEPFNEVEVQNKNPFGFRLVPLEIWKASKFERSFVTSMGQSTFEKLAQIIAAGSADRAENQHTETITINTYRKEKIDEILSMHRNNTRLPNWNDELQEILALSNRRYEELTIRSDLYVRRMDGTEEYYSMKTVKPNLDQTEIAKKDMLSIKAVKENAEVYFALPFNPAGEGNNYRLAHSIPYKIFRMDEDEAVLIGAEFWNKVGQDENTYNQLIQLFEEVGQEYTEMIRVDYLGLE